MTPNNIVGMAKLKGLDAIALTDHNGWQNLPAITKVAREAGLVLLPGLEVTTKEEVHILCYFPATENACEFGELVQQKLPPIQNAPQIFGEQIIMDDLLDFGNFLHDEVTAEILFGIDFHFLF